MTKPMDLLMKAKALAERVEAEATKAKVPVAVCIIDVHGNLVLQHRMNGAPLFSLEISERKADHHGLVAPEVAVLMAYCKIYLYTELLESDLPEDPYLAHDLERYFPPPLPKRHSRGKADILLDRMLDRKATSSRSVRNSNLCLRRYIRLP